MTEENSRDPIAELAARVDALEHAMQTLTRRVQGTPPEFAVPATPGKVSPAPVAARASVSLENRIGGQFLNRIGVLAVLIGMAWFLKLAFDRNWIGPALRVLVGLASAAGLIVWSERFRRRGFAAFAYSLKGLGSGVAYLSLWASCSVFHLAPVWLVFLAMTAVTVANAALSWWQTSELLALYALAGGLATPGLLSAGLGNQAFLFSYLTLLNLGALLLLARHGWTRVAWAALLGTGFYYIGSMLSGSSPANRPLTVFFLSLFFALFAAGPFLTRRREPGATFPIAFPVVNGIATWIALLLLYGGAHHEEQRFWATLLLASAHLAMAWASRTTGSLSYTCLGLGVFLVAVAIPIEFDGYAVTLFWLGESLLLIVCASLWGHDGLRVSGSGVLMLAGGALLADWIAGTPHPLAIVANAHFATALVAAAVFAGVAAISLKARLGEYSVGGWTWLASFASVAFSVTLVIAVSLEIHHYWFCGAGFFRDFCTGYGQLERRRISAGFGLSAWWMIYGAGLMAAGFWRRSSFLRWQALGLLAVSIGKVFLNGVSLENQGYRVLSFLGLGVLLLAVSFAYQKDWLRLREKG